MKMHRLWIRIAAVIFMLVGLAGTGDSHMQNSGASAAQNTPSLSAPAPMQTFTSADGRFSIMFPGTPAQTSQDVTLKNGTVTKLYQFTAEDDNGNTSYIVMYNDYLPSAINTSPQQFLMRRRDGAVAGKTLLSDAEINLNGVPGRAYTASGADEWNFDMRQFLSGVRFYQLIITSRKGHTAAQRDLFMNSFRIL